MSYKVMINAFGLWCPLNTRYFKTRKEAQEHIDRLARTKLDGNKSMLKIVEIDRNKDCGSMFEKLW